MSFKGDLYGFQAEAVKKMLDAGRLLVAYEMGLGKTVITIAAIENLLDAGEVATGLVVVPSALKYQWKRQIDMFTEDATVLVIDGDKAIHSVNHLGPGCDLLHKIVEFDLVSGKTFTLQLSGQDDAIIGLAISASPPSGTT